MNSEVQETDEVLMARYQQGDALALEALVRRYASPLLGHLVRMTRNREQAEDLVQETFLRVHQKAHTYRPDLRFRSWIYAIASHLAIDALRRSSREPGAVPLEAEENPMSQRIPDPQPLPSEQAALSDRKESVRRAVESLPPRQRATLLLAYFEGLSYPEVAAAMHCSVGTVKTQVSRAMQTLARRLPGGDVP